MKFAERTLIMLCLIGAYFALWRKPADLSILFVAAAFLSLVYILGMYLLLKGVTIRNIFSKSDRSAFVRKELLAGLAFGLVNAYCLFSIIYHRLNEMTSLALAENCGLFLILFAVFAGWNFRKHKKVFYKQMLIRTGVWFVIIATSLLFRP